MILQSKGEEEETGPGASGTKPIPEDSTPAAPAIQSIPTIVEEKEEAIVVLVEELDRYFFSSSANSAFSPISKHLETRHKRLSETFPMDLAAFAQL